jgi:hypothetical protein
MTLRSRAVDTVFNVLEFGAAVYDFVSKLRRRVRRDTDPILLSPERAVESHPLSHQDAERIAEFGRRAGHEIPKAPRVPKI